MSRFFDTKTIVISIVTVLAAVCAGVIIVHGSVYSRSDETTSDAATAAVASTSSPALHIGPEESPSRLLIPKISVDANIQHVGVGKTGNMAVPTNYTDVGWYRLGTVPGQIGSAVIDGHVDNGFGKDAVFKNLSTLVQGDDIYVQAQDGSRLHFKVEDAQTYAYADVPMDTIFTRKDTARLTLITCSGSWEGDKGMYDQRLVVSARLVP